MSHTTFWILLDQLNQGPLLRPVMSSVPESIRSRTVGVWSLEGVEGVMASKAVKPLIRTEPFQKECSATGRFISRGVEVELNAFWTSTRLKNVPWSIMILWFWWSPIQSISMWLREGTVQHLVEPFWSRFFYMFFFLNYNHKIRCFWWFLHASTNRGRRCKKLQLRQLRPPLALWQPPRAAKRPHPEGCRFPRKSCRRNGGMSCWGHQTYLHQPWSPANCHSPHKFETSCKCGRVLNCIFELSSNDILMYLDDQVHISLQSKWSQNTWSDSRFPIPKNPACSIPSAGAVASQNIHKQTLFPNSDAPGIFTSLINLGLTTPVAKSLNTACLSLSSGKMWNMWKVYEREKQKSAMHRDAKNDRESVTTRRHVTTSKEYAFSSWANQVSSARCQPV